MDIKRLDRVSKENLPVGKGLNINDQLYYIAVRGLYSQHKKGEISLNQVKEEKEMLVNWHTEINKPVEPIKQYILIRIKLLKQ